MISDLLTVKLEKFTYGGDALGRLSDPLTGMEGRVVFARFGLPGETVRVRVIDEKPGLLRAEVVEVLQASPERIQPKCPHYGVCGGCHYQHLSYPVQLEAKSLIVRDQLIRIGKIENPPVEPAFASPAEWNYRNHVQFHLTDAGKVGYVDLSGRKVFAIHECHLPEGPLNEVWPRLEFDAGLGLERASLRLGAGGEIMLLLESDLPQAPEMELESDLSVVHLSGDDAVVMAGDLHFLIQVNERTFRVSAGSFFQVNTAMAEKMVDHLLANLPLSASATLLDVYCGAGLFSAFFAGKVGRLIGIESSAMACEDFAVNLDEFENVELYEGLAEDILPHLDVKADAVIVGLPPRAGLDKHALDAIIAHAPGWLAYISCDPSTLARDAARLIAGGYRLLKVTPFDLFPQTYHIESISIFEKG